tara:strand:+ start:91 stop:999 length:909 start_codon:yes stop_codon:yes gene_type:complete
MVTRAIVGLVSNPVKSLNSHNGGWTLLIKNILDADVLTDKDDWDKYDELILSEGINYKEGVFNFFGGVQDSFYTKLDKLNKYTGKVYCINEMIDYNVVCNKRKELSGLSCNKIPEIINIKHLSNKLILGDSHSVSVFKPGYTIDRNDGKTLNGFLKIGLKKYIPDNINDLIFYAGNIDIRFHIHRFKGRDTVVDLIRELFKQLEDLNIDNITLVSLLPIEDESRKLPGTGLYKDKPFFGSKEDRTFYVKEFNRLLKRGCNHYGYNLIEWDFNYDDGLSFDDMESRQSVHLRPKSYKYINQLC